MIHLPKKQKILWPDNEYYFMTNSTFLHYPFFRQEDQKQVVLNIFKDLQQKWRIPIQAYSIPMTHNHLMFHVDKGDKVTFTKRFLKGNITREFRKRYKIPYKEFWHSTRVYWVRDDDMYRRVMGYIGGNLLKHKEVSSWQELYDCPFSSFKYLVDKHGWIEARDMVMDVIEVKEDSYGEVDFKGLKPSSS